MAAAARFTLDLAQLRRAVRSLRRFTDPQTPVRVALNAEDRRLELGLNTTVGALLVELLDVEAPGRSAELVIDFGTLMEDVEVLWKGLQKKGERLTAARRQTEGVVQATQIKLTLPAAGMEALEKAVQASTHEAPTLKDIRAITQHSSCTAKCEHPLILPRALDAARVAASTLGLPLDLWTSAVEGGGYLFFGEPSEGVGKGLRFAAFLRPSQLPRPRTTPKRGRKHAAPMEPPAPMPTPMPAPGTDAGSKASKSNKVSTDSKANKDSKGSKGTPKDKAPEAPKPPMPVKPEPAPKPAAEGKKGRGKGSRGGKGGVALSDVQLMELVKGGLGGLKAEYGQAR